MRRVRSPAAARYALLGVLLSTAAGLAACGASSGDEAGGGGHAPTDTRPPQSSPSAAVSCQGTAGSPRAGVVVQPPTGRPVTRCVGVRGGSLAALDALRGSGVEVRTKDFGGKLGVALCQVAHVPEHYSTCPPPGGHYWALFVSRDGNAWSAASKGLSNVTLHPGDSLGLRYDSQQQKTPAPPTAPPPHPQ
jgi:hypothetical protein